MLTFSTIDSNTRCSTFATANGCDESFLSIATTEGASFSDALAEVAAKYADALQGLGLADSSVVFCRIFLSDILNQKSALLATPLYQSLRASCALSVIEQRPLCSGPVSLLAYHIRDPKKIVTKHLSHPVSDGWRNALAVRGNNYTLLLTANQTGGDTFNAYAQTRAIFESLNAVIEENGMRLLDNGIRTWVFVRDLDNHYKDMVRARRECFAEHGLTEKSRYLASTGIQGGAHSPDKIVSMDSLSVGGLAAGQVVRMEALSHLWPTIHYGVTFERGLRVRYGDRSHLYVSGTASINPKGDVMHEGNAELQTRRAVENVSALLKEQKATLKDLAYVIAYVRNAHDRQAVARVLAELLGPQVPLIFTEAAVCRPTWLMELEGVAVTPDETAFPPFL